MNQPTEKKRILIGDVELRGKKFNYELLSDGTNIFVKVFASGKEIEFLRNQNNNLTHDIQAVLVTHGMLNES